MKKHDGKLMIGTMSAMMLAMIVLFWSTATSGQEQQEQTDVSNAWANYEIILKRNIFSRNRAPERVRTSREEAPRVMPNPESYYKLKGIVQEDGVFIAFIEDTRTGSILRYHQGQNVARGAVKNLTLDSMEYEYEDKTAVVEIGRDLEGGLGSVTRTELMEWSSSTSTKTAPASTSSEPATEAESDILKQLRERRQQQLGR